MGFSRIYWGFLFFFDLRIQGIDILPDFIGYGLIYLGLKELVSMNSHFVEAQKYTVVLGILSIFDLYQIQIPMGEFHLNSISGIFMLTGIIIVLLDLLMVFHLCQGIAELAAGKGFIELKNLALSRWRYYLYLRVGMAAIAPVALLMPLLAIWAFIPLFIMSIIVLVLMMGLMRKAVCLTEQPPLWVP